ncbi:DUF427 domain-containing protein [Actinacidiphila glaucinigra]|uniref:DUF427 domain-containing protein n=1 Tax=Actinacidiphila glaucinigra TaxID=235986 RepID=UPI002E376C01|nr:DUF427 domain-containing protein [Actinacidiphila glaucinigra]
MPPTDNRRGHRVEAVPGTQHVTVRIDGKVVAETRRPVLVHETGLPVRYYIPPQDVDLALFRGSDTNTTCPYKGVASYWSYGDRNDVAWFYEEPLPSVPEIAGHLSFYDTVAEVAVEEA